MPCTAYPKRCSPPPRRSSVRQRSSFQDLYTQRATTKKRQRSRMNGKNTTPIASTMQHGSMAHRMAERRVKSRSPERKSTSYWGDQYKQERQPRTVQCHHRSLALWCLLRLPHGGLEVGNERLHDLQRQTLFDPYRSSTQRRHNEAQGQGKERRWGTGFGKGKRVTQRTVHAICTAAGPLNALRCHPLLDILSPTSYTFTDLSCDPKATTEAGGEPRT
jgi:hypothetical protein